MADPLVRVTIEIRLRCFDDHQRPSPVPADVSEAALADVARRLAVYQEGALVTTTLWRDPKDRDSDAIEGVGGGLRVVDVEVRRG